MIPYKLAPTWSLGPLHINMYGVMFALGILIAFYLTIALAKKNGFQVKIVEDLFFYIILGSLIGARIFYLIFYWPKGMEFTFFDIFKVWEGGMAFFGGLIGGLATSFFYIKKHKLNFWKYANLFTIPLIVGHVFGRIGDYLTGGHPGKIAELPWSIFLDGALRHPVVLYEIFGLLIILSTMILINKNEKTKDFLFLIYIQMYSIQRLILDYFRIESTDPRFLGLTPSQYLVILLLISSTFYIFKSIKEKGSK